MLSTQASDSIFPQVVQAASKLKWKLSGEGIFSWTVFRFYRARLFISGKHYDPALPFMLDLEYLRTLLASQIVSVSIDEIKRLRQPEESVLANWSQHLLSILPDVVLGDRLIGLFTPGKGVQLFSAETLLGEINDADFAEAFAAIWLDPDSKADKLRLALLGLEQNAVAQ